MTKAQMVESIFHEQIVEFGAKANNPKVREYAELLTKDLNRKGCIPETYPGPECRACGSCVDGKCPLEDWEKRHPEYKDDELAKKIKALETELYGWHKPIKDHTIWLKRKVTTAVELIAELQKLPEGTTINAPYIEVTLP